MARHMGDPQRLARAKQRAVSRFLPAVAAPKRRFVARAPATARRDNIVGVGVGPKIRNGRTNPDPLDPVLRCEEDAAEGDPRGPSGARAHRRSATDVVETGRFFAQVPIARRRLRPARGGCSVGFQATGFAMAGTFGCLVTDGGERFILSNNHVLADENALPLNSPIFQPGPLDGGVVPGDRIARLMKFVRLRKLPAQNRADAAIAVLDAPGIAVPSILPRVGALGSTAPVRAAVRMRVHKHGRTSGYTRSRDRRLRRRQRHLRTSGWPGSSTR
jgi:hypothetical protein